MIKKNIKNKKGIVLVLALIITSIIFTIALGAISISIKESNLSTSVKDSDDAFFAAESGAECGLYNDIGGIFTASSSSETPVNPNCFFGTLNNISTANPWSFVLTELGVSQRACAIVKIEKIFDSNNELISSRITAKGYNMGDSSCAGENRVERVLELNY